MSPKKKCEGCPRIVRTSKLIKNKLTGQLLCSICNRRIGQNKFYIPKERQQRISKFSITDDEKKVLRKNKSKKQVDKLCNSLKMVRKISRYNKVKEKEEKVNKEFEKTKTKRKFLRGLNDK